MCLLLQMNNLSACTKQPVLLNGAVKLLTTSYSYNSLLFALKHVAVVVVVDEYPLSLNYIFCPDEVQYLATTHKLDNS